MVSRKKLNVFKSLVNVLLFEQNFVLRWFIVFLYLNSRKSLKNSPKSAGTDIKLNTLLNIYQLFI